MRMTRWIVLAVVWLPALAGAARAYESKSVDDVTQGTTRETSAAETTNPAKPTDTTRPPEGVAGGDMLRVNETPLLVTAHVIDVKKGIPIPKAVVTVTRDGGSAYVIGRTGQDGTIEARFELNDPPAQGSGSPSQAGPPRVTVRVRADGYLDASSVYDTASLPKQGRYGWIDMGELRLRPVSP